MRKRAAFALVVFAVAMVCFGILARAVDGAGVAQVKVVSTSAQAIGGEAEGGAPAVEYATCVPLEALHQEGPARYYVFVLEERSGFMGVETAVRKTYVSVLDTGGGFAALADGTLSSQQQVVARADRVIEDGDKARAIDG